MVMLRAGVREAKVEEEFYRLIKNILEKKNFEIEGVRFSDVEPQHPVDSGSADLALFLDRPRKPLLIVECKRKDKTGRIIRNIDPLSPKVIDQALFYATKVGAPLFATTNGRVFALFTKPKLDEPFSIEKHRLLIKEIELGEEHVGEILDFAAKWKSGIPVTKTSIDWAFIVRLRSFVDWLSEQLLPTIEKEAKAKSEFSRKLREHEEKVGKVSLEAFAREAAYLLMNKIIFYKVLERHYPLEKLRSMIAPSSEKYVEKLVEYFNKAIEITEDFEPIFSTGVYDYVPLPEEDWVLEEINAFIEDIEKHRLEEIGSDIIGFIYENLILPEERHALGQFYTPPPIAELIVKWAVRSPEDNVLDPAVGSGTFLIKAYQMLKELDKELDKEFPHEKILSQLYALDINPFPAHLTAMNLAMRDVRHPTSEMNIIVRDFFQLVYGQKFFVAYSIKTPRGEKERRISIPLFDALVANPPYTRWTEIPEKTRMLIGETVGELLKKYNLTARVRQGIEPGIYIHFIMWGLNFLKEGGRLGMIISDSWLQTDYGVDFGRFLLDHFKVKALIDISARVFPVPLIGTCIILLEKCSDNKKRAENKVVFMYADISETEEFKVEEVLEAIENPKKHEEQYIVKTIRQGDIPRNQKWINLLFDANMVLDELKRKTSRIKELFEPSYGNATYLYLASRGKAGGPRNLGTKEFFYLDERKMQQHGLKDFVYPALTSARYAKWFTFTKQDWDELRKKGSPCYFFMCHQPRNKLPKNVLDYIKWGETECRTTIRGSRGGGKICSEALACQAREKKKEFFYGWYDLGGVKKAPIMAIRQSQYKTRFIFAKCSIVTYDAIITFIPKSELTEVQTKALLAYLNSSFTQLYIESIARITGMGVAALEVKHAEQMPILDVRNLNQRDLKLLASLFEELEAEARRLGGADTEENVEKLWDTVIEKIDLEIMRILGLPKGLAKSAKNMAKAMMKRRLQRTEEAVPEAVKSEEEPRLKPYGKTEESISLSRFMQSSSD